MAAAKEASNTATHFLWTQLRALGSHLEARAWHRRDLTKAELAANAPITGIHSAPSKGKPVAPCMPAAKKAVLGGQKAAAPAKEPVGHHSKAGQHSEAAQHKSDAAPSSAGKKRKRQELASQAMHPLNHEEPSHGPIKAAERETLQSHPIQLDEDMPSPPDSHGSASRLAGHADASTAKAGNPGPSSAAHQIENQDTGLLESLEQLAARARIHRHYLLSDSTPHETKLLEASLASTVAVQASDTQHDVSQGRASSRPDSDSQRKAAKVNGADVAPAGALNGRHIPEKMAAAGDQEALTPKQELARQREIAQHDAVQLDVILQDLNQQMGRIWQAVPANGLLIIMAGHGDTSDVRRLQVNFTRPC